MGRRSEKEERRMEEKNQSSGPGKQGRGEVVLSNTISPVTSTTPVNQTNPERDKESEEDRITELLNHFDVVNSKDNMVLIKSFWDGEITVEDAASQINVNASELKKSALPCVALTFEKNDKTIKALFDSGAGISLINSSIVDKLNVPVETCQLTLRLANNKTCNVTKKVYLNCIVGDKIGTIQFLVTDELSYDAMLGNDFINSWKVETYSHRGMYSFEDSDKEFPFVYHRFTENVVNAVVSIEPRLITQTSVKGKVQPKGTYSMKKGDPKIRFGQNPFTQNIEVVNLTNNAINNENEGPSGPLPHYRHPLQRLSDIDPIDECIQRMTDNKPKVGYTNSNISKQLGKLYGITDTRFRPCVVPLGLLESNMINPSHFSHYFPREDCSENESSEDDYSQCDSDSQSESEGDLSEVDEDYIPHFNYPYKSSTRPK